MPPAASSSSSSADADALQAQLAAALQEISRQAEENSRQAEQISRLRRENADQQLHLEDLEKQLAVFARIIWGPKRERYVLESHPDQLCLFDDMQDEQDEEPPPPPEPETKTNGKKKRGKPKRSLNFANLPDHLPRDTRIIEPDGDLTGLQCIGVERTRYLEIVPRRMKVVEILRRKYVDPNDEDKGVIIGKLPPRVVDKGMAGPGLLADVLVSKYTDHMPLYRQQQRFRREGIAIAKSTLGGWIAQVARHLEPLYDVLRQEVLSSGYLQVDESTIKVQDRTKPGTTHRGYYWLYHTPERKLLVMEYCKTRARAGPAAFLRGYRGVLQTDGYVVYDVFDTYPRVTVYGCMAHARRKFFEARAYEPARGRHVLREIRRLYKIERGLREAGACADRRRAVRQAEARPVLERLQSWLELNRGLPRSPWGQAVDYMRGSWARLIRYLDEGRVELDNNLIENAVRPLALGRKNYLFAGSHAAAQRAAVVYSLLGTCKLHGINCQQWLTDVLERLPTHPSERVADLLPHHWKELQQAYTAKAA